MDNLTWLWLDHYFEEERTIHKRLKDLKQDWLGFSQPQDLTSFLIKQKKEGKLSTYSLMIEPFLPGNTMIFSPKQWNGVDNFGYPTNKSLDAGFVFYEKVIMNEDQGPIWHPLPETVFLSDISLYETPVHLRMASIAHKWSMINGSGLENVLVSYKNKLEFHEGKVFF